MKNPVSKSKDVNEFSEKQIKELWDKSEDLRKFLAAHWEMKLWINFIESLTHQKG